MASQLSVHTADGGSKSEAQIVSKVLSKNTVKPSFLQNVGLVRSSGSKMKEIIADLEVKNRGSAKLLYVVYTQQEHMNELTSQVHEVEIIGLTWRQGLTSYVR